MIINMDDISYLGFSRVQINSKFEIINDGVKCNDVGWEVYLFTKYYIGSRCLEIESFLDPPNSYEYSIMYFYSSFNDAVNCPELEEVIRMRKYSRHCYELASGKKI